jgi:4-aminobutyrate aminotransferase-like enzyme
MEPAIRVDRLDPLYALESQVRECFGRVVYSHKTHEKCGDIALSKLSHIKLWQLVLSAITTGGLIAVVFGNASQSKTASGFTALVSTALLALNAYTKDNDPGQIAQKHKTAADQLWGIREAYLSLLTDIRSGDMSAEQARHRRDQLQSELATAYAAAPRTSSAAYTRASKALKVNEDLTFSDDEIDQFLPAALRRGRSGAPDV